MKQKQLLDTAIFTADSFEKAYAVLEELTGSVSVLPQKTHNIRVLSYIDEDADGNFEVALSTRSVLDDVKLSKKAGMPTFIKMERAVFTKDGKIDEDYIEEFKRNGFILSIDKELYLASVSTLGTLCLRCNIDGGGIFSSNSVLRDNYIAELLYKARKKCNVIIRRSDDGAVNKIFAVLGGAYSKIPQTIVKDIVSNCEKDLECEAVLSGFVADNFITRMTIEFPKISDDFAKTYELPDAVHPGVCISTSDIGDSSLSVWGSVRVGASTIPMYWGEYARKHSGKIDLEEILEGIREKVFVDFARAPEALLNLLGVEIGDPIATIKEVCKRFKKVIGAAFTEELVEALSAEITTGKKYTAYDIATLIISAPDRVKGMPASNLLAFQKCVKDVLFIDYTKMKSSLYLTA